ncbi:methyltransferase domain-containing protein [Candidatus Bathyarchaeota archaeon]|nr:methyltransferase domain-containing protein [Candidatus Bathyarchaeota archaeon]
MSSNNADAILKRIERSESRYYLPIIGPRKAKILEKCVRDHKPKRILEVGTLVGYSCIVMAKELDADSEIISIEEDESEANIARENIRQAMVKPKITIMTGDAITILPKLMGSFDLVFIDADKNQYYDYLKIIENKINLNGIIIADNAGFYSNSMRKYLDYVRKSGKYESTYYEVNWDGMEISIKKF